MEVNPAEVLLVKFIEVRSVVIPVDTSVVVGGGPVIMVSKTKRKYMRMLHNTVYSHAVVVEGKQGFKYRNHCDKT